MNRKPRIAVIGLKGIPAYGGAATVGENIAEKLKDDFDMTILSVSSHTSLNSGYVNGIKQIVFKKIGQGGLNTFYYYFRCLIHCLVHNYNLVHLHHSESGFITPFLRFKYNVIVTFHGIHNYPDPKFSSVTNRFFRYFENLNLKYATEIISVSKPDQEYISCKYHKVVNYIPNGINISNNLNNKSIQIQTKKNYILFAANRIYHIKGLHLLIEAAKKINLQTEILVIGNMDAVPDYKNEIIRLSESQKINLIGHIKTKSELMRMVAEAELFVFPSLKEAMSMMLLEVVSMKSPVIASDIPSNKAIFSDEEVLFFRNNDAEDLAKKLQYAIDNKTLIAHMAERAYDKLAKLYTWDLISEQYKVIFNKYLIA